MIKRIVSLLALAGAGWYLFNRFAKPRLATTGDTTDQHPDDQNGQRGGAISRVAQAATGAASTAIRSAQAPLAKARALVGGDGVAAPDADQPAPGEDGDNQLTTETAARAGAGSHREPSPTDASRSAVEAPSAAESATPREAGSTMPGHEPSERQSLHAASPAAGPSPAATRPESRAEPEPTIKGNVRADGEKIYHLPQDPAYERTHAEQMFATVEEAETAGFRRAGRPRDS